MNKDYKAIAKIMKSNLQYCVVGRIKVIDEKERKRINDLANQFEKEDVSVFNKNIRKGEFDKEQFLKDCGIDENDK